MTAFFAALAAVNRAPWCPCNWVALGAASLNPALWRELGWV